MNELLTTNSVQTAFESIEPFVERSVYHSFSKALLLITICLCTYDKVFKTITFFSFKIVFNFLYLKSDIERAAKSVEELNQTCNKYRKTGFVVSLMKIIKTPNYQKYTDSKYLGNNRKMIHEFNSFCQLNLTHS